jgi:murein L,D-transpeptidase YcbB/YkuD
VDSSTLESDSVKMSQSIKKAQLFYGLRKDGKAGKLMVAALNSWKQAKYARMAINMDRYRMLPDSLPESYILVNIPSFTLEARFRDSLVFHSKVIVGKPNTRSPLLNSVFTNIVVYPQWNVPESIVLKEIIPKMQKDPHYLHKQNMVILDKRDSIIDPFSINWAKANKKNFRYRIRQGEGLDNSLGIIKFNFSNRYSVYLHDTNVRSLFKLEDRSLSHGCIRVENWQQMANFLVAPGTNPVQDSTILRLLRAEKKANKQLRVKTSLFIRYFTLYNRGDGLKWYPDIYGEDNQLIDSYLY